MERWSKMSDEDFEAEVRMNQAIDFMERQIVECEDWRCNL